jgi:hypothetical protein
MTTTQVVQQTTLEPGPAVHKLDKSVYLHSGLWKEIIEKFLKVEPKVFGGKSFAALRVE